MPAPATSGDLVRVNLIQTYAMLRRVPTVPEPFVRLYVVQGKSSANDGNISFFFWNPAATGGDNDDDRLKPNDRQFEGGGAWVKLPGTQGPTGATGSAGAAGADGAPGAVGSPGTSGPPGLDGLDGAEGPQGMPGTPGATGATGATGSQGLQGPPGTDGTDGIDGEQGPPGLPGVTGATGATGSVGPQGPPGLDGLDGAEGPQGQPGQQGIQGIQGIQGLPGIGGSTGGTATLDFGSTPTDEASVVVTGQAAILSGSRVKAWFQADTTADNGTDEHTEGGSLCPLTIGSIVAGTGFTIFAHPIAAMGLGQFTVHWEWA